MIRDNGSEQQTNSNKQHAWKRIFWDVSMESTTTSKKQFFCRRERKEIWTIGLLNGWQNQPIHPDRKEEERIQTDRIDLFCVFEEEEIRSPRTFIDL